MNIARINMKNRTVNVSPTPEKYERFGGRALTSRIVADEVPPTCHALGRHNKLVIANGLLAGTSAPNSGRISVGTKSPLTGGIKESNVGSNVGQYLFRAGIRALVVEELPDVQGLWFIVVDESGVRLEDASDCKNLGTYKLVEKLHEKYGEKIAALCVGPAGERRLAAAALMATDLDGRPSRAAGRGGTGAVLGAKGIKAVVCLRPPARQPEYHDAESFKTTAREFSQELRKSKAGLTTLGTAAMVKGANLIQGMPTRNYSRAQFDRADGMNGEALFELIEARGGKTSRPCHQGCVISCSNIFVDEKGDYVTGSLEYETMVMVGPNLDIGDLDDLARIDRAMDDVGLDSIESGAALGVAMEMGMLPWGDAAAVLEILSEVPDGGLRGLIIGSGAAVTGKVLGARRVPTVKGQSMVAYDPRTFKGMGCVFATSPMGADHTAGPAIPGRIGLDPDKSFELTEAAGQAELSRDLQIMITVCDSLGYCFFVGPDMANMRRTVTLLNALYGWDIDYDGVLDIGISTLNIEKQYNRAAGITPQQDRLPEFIMDEPAQPSGRTFDVPQNELTDLDYNLS